MKISPLVVLAICGSIVASVALGLTFFQGAALGFTVTLLAAMVESGASPEYPCPFCKGDIPAGVTKCRHCASEVPFVPEVTAAHRMGRAFGRVRQG